MYCILVFTYDCLPSQKLELTEQINEIVKDFGEFYTPDEIPNVRYISMNKNSIEELRSKLISLGIDNKNLKHFVISPLINGKCDGLLYKAEWAKINDITGK